MKNNILQFLQEIKLQQEKSILEWKRTKNNKSHIEHIKNLAVVYASDALDEFIKSTGRIYYYHNSHHENVIMIEELIEKAKK